MTKSQTSRSYDECAAIALFKSERPWCHHVLTKLSLTQKLTVLYAAPVIEETGIDGLIDHLNRTIEANNIERIFFFLDFFYGLDKSFVERVTQNVVKILVTFDDLTLHGFNAHTASVCDLVLSADPLSVLKYQEAGIQAGLFLLESSRHLYKRKEVEKTTDVLFFGNEGLADRNQYLEYLRANGVSLRSIGGKDRYIDAVSLVDEIVSAKIVINFSKTGYLGDGGVGQVGQQCLFQLKGRIIESGLCGTACISEYAPAVRLLFNQDEVPVFRSKVECLRLIKEFLRNDNKRMTVANSLFEKCISEFEDEPLMQQVESLIGETGLLNGKDRNAEATILPWWYRKRVVRARIQLVWASPKEILRELAGIFNSPRNSPKKDSAILLLNTLCWMGYHFIRRRTC